jgi:hypothetical protein
MNYNLHLSLFVHHFNRGAPTSTHDMEVNLRIAYPKSAKRKFVEPGRQHNAFEPDLSLPGVNMQPEGCL